MPLTYVPVVRAFTAVQYTGSNGDEIVSWLGGNAVRTPDPINLIVTKGGIVRTAAPTDWVLRSKNSMWWGVNTNDVYLGMWSRLEPTISLGAAATPLMVGNSTATVDVSLAPVPSNAFYTPVAIVTGPATVIAVLTVQSWQVISNSTVRVTLRNTGLAALGGGTVLVAASQFQN